MRINDKDIKNAEISVVSRRNEQTPNGIRRIFVYEARVTKKTRTLKKQSEDLGILQNWVLAQTGAA